MPRTKKIIEKSDEGKGEIDKEKLGSLYEEKPIWLKYNEKDIEAVILKLGKQEMTSEKIGLVLRDSYGIPSSRILGKKIGKILKDNNLYKNADLENLKSKLEKIKKHLEKNKQDQRAKRALTIISARIRKVEQYKERKNKKIIVNKKE